MNNYSLSDVADTARMLNKIKTETKASFARISVSAIGTSIQIDWDDNCHCRKTFSDEELWQARFDVVQFIIDYANREHEKLVSAK